MQDFTCGFAEHHEVPVSQFLQSAEVLLFAATCTLPRGAFLHIMQVVDGGVKLY